MELTQIWKLLYEGPQLLEDHCTLREPRARWVSCISSPAAWIYHAQAITWKTSTVKARLLKDISKNETHQVYLVLHLILGTPLPEAQVSTPMTICFEIREKAQSPFWRFGYWQQRTIMDFTDCVMLQASPCSLQDSWSQNLNNLARQSSLIY